MNRRSFVKNAALLCTAVRISPGSVFASGPPKPITYLEPTRSTYLKFAEEIEGALRRDVLDVWFPRTVDNEHGGFRSDFARDWSPALGVEASSRCFRGA